MRLLCCSIALLLLLVACSPSDSANEGSSLNDLMTESAPTAASVVVVMPDSGDGTPTLNDLMTESALIASTITPVSDSPDGTPSLNETPIDEVPATEADSASDAPEDPPSLNDLLTEAAPTPTPEVSSLIEEDIASAALSIIGQVTYLSDVATEPDVPANEELITLIFSDEFDALTQAADDVVLTGQMGLLRIKTADPAILDRYLLDLVSLDEEGFYEVFAPITGEFLVCLAHEEDEDAIRISGCIPLDVVDGDNFLDISITENGIVPNP